MPRDPRRMLVRLLLRLGERPRLITFDILERAAARSCPKTIPRSSLEPLLESSVQDLLVLMDRRTFLDVRSTTLESRYVFRVNRRHPLAAEELAG